MHGVVALGGSGGTSIAAGSDALAAVDAAEADCLDGRVGRHELVCRRVGHHHDVQRGGHRGSERRVAGRPSPTPPPPSQAWRRATLRGTRRARRGLDARRARDASRSPCLASLPPAVTVARGQLEAMGFEVYVFHATGAGGRASE